MIAIPIPPSVNHLWRIVHQRRRNKGDRLSLARTAHYEAWLFEASYIMRTSLPRPKLPTRVRIRIRGGDGWNPARDLDNAIKAIQDALVHAGRLPDDTTRYVHGVTITYDPPAPGLPACCTVGFEDQASQEIPA